MKAIFDLSKEYGFAIVEDASHCIGGEYKGRKIGSCEYSHACVFSFHPVKIMTTGEGGALLTNNPELYKKFALLRSHGITRDESMFVKESHGGWYYEQIDLGPNYRMTDIQAALGSSQLSKLDKFIEKRRALAARYDALFADVSEIRPYQLPDSNSSWHLYVVRVEPENRVSVYIGL
jgi:dTDP-4-amino-4,6-dideoxygalactose transaminase